MYNEKTLDDLCYAYWERYTKALEKSEDGYIILEQSELNTHRSNWLEGERRIHCLYRSKRFVSHVDVLGQVLRWMAMHGTSDSVVELNEEDLFGFTLFPESF
jgi:hypothetical protein